MGKTNSFFFLLLFSAPFWGCRPDTETKSASDCSEKPYNCHILILLDKSGSIRRSPAMTEDFRRNLALWVADSLGTRGDRIQGVLLHENSLGVTPFLREELRAVCPDPREMRKLGGRDVADVKSKYKREKSAFYRECNRLIKAELDSTNRSATKQHTDLWASLDLMSDFFEDAKPGDRKYVLFISDLEESMKGPGRRDFHANPPKTTAEARKMAETDVLWIKENLDVQEEVIRDAVIRIIPPVGTTDQNNLEFLKRYWERLFRLVGVVQKPEYGFKN